MSDHKTESAKNGEMKNEGGEDNTNQGQCPVFVPPPPETSASKQKIQNPSVQQLRQKHHDGVENEFKSNKNLDLVLLTCQGTAAEVLSRVSSVVSATGLPDQELVQVKEVAPSEGGLRPPTPPDGGYGWVVVIAAFIINAIVDGTCFSFAIYFSDLGDYYGQNESIVAWVGSSLVGCYLLIGPFAGALANKFGCRAVTVSGALLSGTSFLFSQFSPNVYVLIFLYGIMGGIGMGLCYLPSVVVVGLYFEKRRALATGISVCGSGIGCFAIPPLMMQLLEEYGWRGAVIISAGIQFNNCICGLLMRPLPKQATDGVAPIVLEVENPDANAMSYVSYPRLQTNDRINSEASEMDSAFMGSRTSFHQSGLVVHPTTVTLKPDEELTPRRGERTRRERALSECVTPRRQMALKIVAIDDSEKHPNASRHKSMGNDEHEPDAKTSELRRRLKSENSTASDSQPLDGVPSSDLSSQNILSTIDEVPSDSKTKAKSDLPAITETNGEARGRDMTTPNVGNVSIDLRHIQMPSYGGAPRRLGPGNRQTATVATGLTNYYLVENSPQPSRYWDRKNGLEFSPEGSQFSLHAVPANISLQWIDNTGSMPHPEVILKYKAPPLKRTESALTKIPSTPNINPEQMLPPLSKKDVFYSRSILDIDHYQSMRSGLTNFQPMEEDADKMEATEDVDELDEKLVPKKTCCQICCIGLRSMIDCSIMTSPTFLAYCMSGTLVILGLTIPFMYIMKYADSVGVKRQLTTWFISVIGIANCVFRVFVGLISDAQWVDVVHFSTIAMLLGGVATILLPLCAHSFATICVYCVAFALSIACYVSLRSIVVVQLFGLENLTSAFGMSLLFQGFASLVGPPLGGLLYEASGSYTLTFLSAGLAFIFAGLLHAPIKKIATWEGKRKKKNGMKM